MRITIVNLCAEVPGPSVRDTVRAVQRQLNEDFAPIWGMGAQLRVVDRVSREWDSAVAGDVLSSDGVVYVTPDVGAHSGAVGLHTKHSAGLPSGFVFPNVPFDWGGSWSIALSHEVLEMIVDPDLNLLVATEKDGQTVLRPYEICDPVQATPYNIDGVQVSNFVTPQYFKRAERHPQGLQSTNFLGLNLKPFDAFDDPDDPSRNGYYKYFDLETSTWESSGVDSWAVGRKAADRAPRTVRRERFMDGKATALESLSGLACSNGGKCLA